WIFAQDRADDFQRLPWVFVVIRGMQLQPAQALLFRGRREFPGVLVAVVKNARPLARGALHGIIDRRDTRRKRPPGADVVAPVGEHLRPGRPYAAQDTLAWNAGTF